MSIRFLNRVIPKQHESLYSFLFRTTNANYIEDIKAVIPSHSFYKINCNDLNSDHQWVAIAEDTVKNLNQDINQFVCNQFDQKFCQANGEEDFLKSKARRMYYLHKFTKYCPYCLKEDLYHRLYWDVSFVTTCTMHKTHLIKNCPNCDRNISMHSVMSGECKCGYNLLNSTPISFCNDATLNIQMIFQNALLNKYEIKRSDGTVLSEKQFLLLFSLFFQLLRFLPTDEFGGKESDSKFEVFYSNHLELEDCLIEYMDFLVPLINDLIIAPEKELLLLYSTIDKLKLNTKVKYIASKKSRILKEIFDLPEGGIYANIYAEYNLEHKDYFLHRSGIVKLDPLEKKFLGIAEAQRVIGKSKAFVQSLCNSNLIKHKTTELNGNTLTLFENESLLNWLQYSEQIISSMDAKRLLGANKRQFQELMDTNFLKPVHGPSIDGMPSYFVEREAVHNLDKLLRNKCKEVSIINDTWITLFSAKDKLGKGKVSFIYLLQLVMDNKIKVVHLKSERIIKGLYFSKRDIQTLRLNIFKSFVEENGYTKEELMRIFSLQTKSINEWFRTGLLHADYTVKRGPQSFLYVNKDQVIKVLTDRMSYTEKQAIVHLNNLDKKFSSIDHLK